MLASSSCRRFLKLSMSDLPVSDVKRDAASSPAVREVHTSSGSDPDEAQKAVSASSALFLRITSGDDMRLNPERFQECDHFGAGGVSGL